MFNLGFLGYFKYSAFLVCENLDAIAGTDFVLHATSLLL